MRTVKTLAAALIAAMMWTAASAADFGKAPTNYEAAAIDYISSRMADDRGARFQFSGKPYRVMASFGRRGEMPGWAVDVRVRSALREGRSAGMSRMTVIFVGGSPVALEDDIGRVKRM